MRAAIWFGPLPCHEGTFGGGTSSQGCGCLRCCCCCCGGGGCGGAVPRAGGAAAAWCVARCVCAAQAPQLAARSLCRPAGRPCVAITEPIKNLYGSAWTALVLKLTSFHELLSLGGADAPPDRPKYGTRKEAIDKHGVSLGWVFAVDDEDGDEDDDAAGGASVAAADELDHVYSAWRVLSMAIATSDTDFPVFDTANATDFEHLAICGLKAGVGKTVTLDGQPLSPWAQTLFHFRASQIGEVSKELHSAIWKSHNAAPTKRRKTGSLAKPAKAAKPCPKCVEVLQAAEEAGAKVQEERQQVRERLGQIVMPTKAAMEALAAPFNLSAFPVSSEGTLSERIEMQKAKWINKMLTGEEAPPAFGAGTVVSA